MSISPLNSGLTYPAGISQRPINTPFQISASPNSGNVFSFWSIEGNGTILDITANPTTLTLTGDAQVTCYFSVATTYTLIMAAFPQTGGSTTPLPGISSQPPNTPVSISATPLGGWIFKRWTCQGPGIIADANSCNTTILLQGNASVIAYFIQQGSWAENGWQPGNTILWDVPYQGQSSFRNWTTACLPTSTAMLINFFYNGAHYSSFLDITGAIREDNRPTASNSFQTTGERLYEQGLISDNDYNGDFSVYVQEYPKNGVSQHYNEDWSDGFGPLKKEKFSSGERCVTTNTLLNTGGIRGSLETYLERTHGIITEEITEDLTITALRNKLYHGPIICSLQRNGYSHIILIIGVNADGNFLIHDPWGSDFASEFPTADNGRQHLYTADSNRPTVFSAYGVDYTLKWANVIPVEENFRKMERPFSCYNTLVTPNSKFKYDYSGGFNESYNGDGTYQATYNGFSYWSSGTTLEAGWKKYYQATNALSFIFTQTDVTESRAAKSTPRIVVDGRHEILVGFYVDQVSNSREVTYRVSIDGVEFTQIIDQTTTANAVWQSGNYVFKSLGQYQLSPRSNCYVKVTNQSSQKK